MGKRGRQLRCARGEYSYTRRIIGGQAPNELTWIKERKIHKTHPAETLQAQQLCEFCATAEQIRLSQSATQQRRQWSIALRRGCTTFLSSFLLFSFLLFSSLFSYFLLSPSLLLSSLPLWFVHSIKLTGCTGMGVQAPRLHSQQQGGARQHPTKGAGAAEAEQPDG